MEQDDCDAILNNAREVLSEDDRKPRTTRYIYPTTAPYPEAILERGRQCAVHYSRHTHETELMALRRMVGALIRQAISLQEAIRKLEEKEP